MASGPIIAWQIEGEKVEVMTDCFFLASKITILDGDCSHEIRRKLLPGRKAMTNLDSVLKSKDITLPTKVCIVQAMVFPVVTYHCESWTVKKAEHRSIDTFKLWCWRRRLRVPWTARRSNQSILREINSEYSLEGTDAEAEAPVCDHLMQSANTLEKSLTLRKIEGRRRGCQRIRWLDDITRCNVLELRQISGDGERHGALACCSP